MNRSIGVLIACLVMMPTAQGQTFNEIDTDGNITQRDGRNGNRNFNPHSNDTTSNNKVVPKGIHVWTVDRRFGDMRKCDVDTLPHLYPQSTMGTGTTGEYNTVGSNYTARLSRIFANRRSDSQMLFTDAYDQVLREPDEWHFTNTLSPLTNLSYGSCGDKTNGEDLIDARFAVNAGKLTGIGFDLDYRYARGYYQNQNNSHFGASVYLSHLGDRYQSHILLQTYHHKAHENGGITNDDYITHPELFSESFSDNEIPTVLGSNWNRNNRLRLFLTHRYNVGFYRKVPMTEEEIKAKKFAMEAAKEKEQAKQKEEQKTVPMLAGRPDNAKVVADTTRMNVERITLNDDTLRTDSLLADSTANVLRDSGRISVTSKEMADSLIALQAQADSTELFMKQEFVPVTSFIHTAEVTNHDHIYQAYFSPKDYYANTYYDLRSGGGYRGDSIYDKTKYLHLRNTLAIGLLEGFNKYAPAGLKAFAAHELRRFDMPVAADTDGNGLVHSTMHRWTEHNVSIGGQLSKAQGHTLHYDLTAETWVAGEDAGQLMLDARGDLNFPFLGDTVRLDAKAFLHRLSPTFLQRHYHSKHFAWDNDFHKVTHSRIEGLLTIGKTGTKMRVALDEIENYTYLAMAYTLDGENRKGLTAQFRQHDASLAVVTAQLDQQLHLGPLNWDNVVTFQTCNNKDVLPLPTLNVFTNLYLKFVVANVLSVELGASGTWFTKYKVPDYLPQLSSFAVQQNDGASVELGNFPFVDVYANLHLKHTRFFVMMSNVTGTNFDRKSFLTPHYPLNRSVLHIGVSWNFFN